MIQLTEERLAGSTRRKALALGFVLAALMAASLLAAKPAHAASLIVNSTNDPGNGICDMSECTLREAIKDANNNPGPDIIRFNIPGPGVKTIKPGANGYGSLPEITDQVIIAGYTQPGASPNTLAQGAPTPNS